VDAIAEVTSYAAYADFSERRRGCGFKEDTSEGAPICRWRQKKNAATGEYALRVGLIWWALGMGLAFGYFVFVYRMFRGKVRPGEGHGY
jgi:hypothetical protein